MACESSIMPAAKYFASCYCYLNTLWQSCADGSSLAGPSTVGWGQDEKMTWGEQSHVLSCSLPPPK